MARYIPVDRLIALFFKCTKKEVHQWIKNYQVKVNGNIITKNEFIHPSDEVIYLDQVIQKGTSLLYYKYYKPVGIETTLNLSINNNLKSHLPIEEHVFPVGRLDKHSEGLLILTNDGALYNAIAHEKSLIEKEYLIQLNKEITPIFLNQFASGVEIMGSKTLPCIITPISSIECIVILKEGKNRQIRRMCYKLGYEVIRLKRIRIHNVKLNNILEGELALLNEEEKLELIQLKKS
jgi:23S rRNA pseudouridine2604 synthase